MLEEGWDQLLCPYSPGNSITKGRTNVEGSEIQSSNDSDVFGFTGGLYRSLRGKWNKTTS